MNESCHAKMGLVTPYQNLQVELKKKVWRFLIQLVLRNDNFFSTNNFTLLFLKETVVQMYCLFYLSLSGSCSLRDSH